MKVSAQAWTITNLATSPQSVKKCQKIHGVGAGDSGAVTVVLGGLQVFLPEEPLRQEVEQTCPLLI